MLKAMRHHVKMLVALFVRTGDRWSEIEGYRLGASFSFYATFSIFPLLLLAVTVVGFFVGDDTPARERLLAAAGGAGSPVREVLAQTTNAMEQHSSARGWSAAIALFGLLFSASGAFTELDATLNRIWCVPKRESEGIVGTIKVFVTERLSGFLIVGGIGITLVASLVTSAVLSALVAHAPLGSWMPAISRTAEVTASIVIMSGVFVAAFHFIPRSRPPLREIVGGAVLTTVLLMALKEVFALYLSHLTRYSAYGVVGGFLALATWIYLSSQIIFLGATLTRCQAEMLGDTKDACGEENAGRPPPESAERPAHA